MNGLQWVLHKLFGFEFVLLFDSDGEVSVRRCIKLGSHLTAWRYGYGCTRVILNKDGTISGPSWVKRWEPLTWSDQEAAP